MAKRKKRTDDGSAKENVFEWRENNVCVATYNVLEGDQFLDQFEDVDLSFEDAPNATMKSLRYFPKSTGNPDIIQLLGIEMARDFLTQVSKTFTLTKQIPAKKSATTIRELAAIFSDGERTILDLARVLDENIRFPDEQNG